MLRGRVAIVTGSGRGVGQAIAKLMAKYGAQVVVNDPGVNVDGTGHDNGPADQTVAAIKKAGGSAVANYDSVVTFEGATNIVKTAQENFGELHVVVTAAGILRDRMLHKMSPEEWQAVMDVHLHGTAHVCRAAINIFREQGYGRIITFTSTSGLIGGWGQTNYGAAKLAIVGLTRNLAGESKDRGITVNCIAPSANTRMAESVPPPADPAQQARRLRLLEKSSPNAIAPLAVYLASEQAGHITGQVFHQRANEISIISMPNPVRTVHCEGGWIPETIQNNAMSALKPFFTPGQRTNMVFPMIPMD